MTKQVTDKNILFVLYMLLDHDSLDGYRAMLRIGFTMLDWKVKLQNQN